MRVPLLQRNQNENPYSWEWGKDHVESGVGETLGATAEDAWYYSPFSSAMRGAEDAQTAGIYQQDDYGLPSEAEALNTYAPCSPSARMRPNI